MSKHPNAHGHTDARCLSFCCNPDAAGFHNSRLALNGRLSSVEDDLINLFLAGGPHPSASPEEVARDILNKHAHELAKELYTRFDAEVRANSLWADGWLSAADYIRPGAQEVPVECTHEGLSCQWAGCGRRQ